jgi:hypothetical protein
MYLKVIEKQGPFKPKFIKALNIKIRAEMNKM